MGLGLSNPNNSPNLNVNACCKCFSSARQTADLYMILLDEESKNSWVIASTTYSPNPTQKAYFSLLVEGKDWLCDALYTD